MTKAIRHGLWQLSRQSLDIHVITLTQSNEIKKSFNPLKHAFKFSIQILTAEKDTSWFPGKIFIGGAGEAFVFFHTYTLNTVRMHFCVLFSSGTEAKN